MRDEYRLADEDRGCLIGFIVVCLILLAPMCYIAAMSHRLSEDYRKVHRTELQDKAEKEP